MGIFNASSIIEEYYKKLVMPMFLSIYIKELCPSVRRSFPCQTAVLSQPGYWVSLSVRDIPQCHGYHLVSGLFVRKTGSLSVMGELLGGF